MIYQSELSIFDSNLNVEIMFLNSDENKNKTIKLNANDILKDSGIDEDKKIQHFIYFYNMITSELKQKNDFALKKVICSNLSFNRRIPLHETKTFDELNLYDDKAKLKKEIIKSLNDCIHTVYYCNDRTDLVIACIYHFLNNGYRLKKCPICKNWFLENVNAKIKYCDFDKIDNEKYCTKKANSIREIKRRDDSPAVALDKKIRDMLDKRKDDEGQKQYSEYMIAYLKAKDTLNNEHLLKWLEEQHSNYLRRKKGGGK